MPDAKAARIRGKYGPHPADCGASARDLPLLTRASPLRLRYSSSDGSMRAVAQALFCPERPKWTQRKARGGLEGEGQRWSGFPLLVVMSSAPSTLFSSRSRHGKRIEEPSFERGALSATESLVQKGLPMPVPCLSPEFSIRIRCWCPSQANYAAFRLLVNLETPLPAQCVSGWSRRNIAPVHSSHGPVYITPDAVLQPAPVIPVL